MSRFAVVLLSALLLCSACKVRRRAHTPVSELELGRNDHNERILGGLYRSDTGGWRWTARTFDVVLDPPVTSGATYLEFDGSVPFELLEQDPTISLIASVNGIEVGRQTWYAPGRTRFSRYVPEAALRQKPAKVHFELTRSVRNADGRELGMIAVSLALKPWEDSDEYRSERIWFARDGFQDAGKRRETEFPLGRQLEFIRSFESTPAIQQAKFQGIAVDKNPLDLWTGQQIVYEIAPDVVIETGTGAGGAALYWAHVLAGMNTAQARVITIDTANRAQDAAKHPLWSKYVDFIQASPAATAAAGIAAKVKDRRVVAFVGGRPDTENILEELEAFGPMVSSGSYLVVENTYLDRESTSSGSGPYQALQRFLHRHSGEFEQDSSRELMAVTRNPGGWLRRK